LPLLSTEGFFGVARGGEKGGNSGRRVEEVRSVSSKKGPLRNKKPKTQTPELHVEKKRVGKKENL